MFYLSILSPKPMSGLGRSKKSAESQPGPPPSGWEQPPSGDAPILSVPETVTSSQVTLCMRLWRKSAPWEVTVSFHNSYRLRSNNHKLPGKKQSGDCHLEKPSVTSFSSPRSLGSGGFFLPKGNGVSFQQEDFLLL